MKHPQLTITVFLLMLLFNISGYGLNNYYFNIIGRDKGLSQSNVKAIIQDSNGFMWFGTRNKLNRYDGNTFKIFDCYDYVAQNRITTYPLFLKTGRNISGSARIKGSLY